jgi:5-methylcytosine-specific restriction protein A
MAKAPQREFSDELIEHCRHRDEVTGAVINVALVLSAVRAGAPSWVSAYDAKAWSCAGVAESLCRDCKAKGIIRAAVTPDHILPLALGGEDVDSNIRCLCQMCHDRRTAEQFKRKVVAEVGVDGWHLP